MQRVTLTLRNGTKCKGDWFGRADYKTLRRVFRSWVRFNKKLKTLGGRNQNVPDVLSEALSCVFFKAARTNGQAHSYDCVSLIDHAGIQIKSCSLNKDCTSFGPSADWDELWFVDFAPNGQVDGNVWFYKIDSDIRSLVLNESKGETFEDQQGQGRRPRFSIKSRIIQSQGLQPVLKINLHSRAIPK